MVIRDLIIRVSIREVVLRQFQDDCDQHKELASHFPHITVKVTDLFPILFNDLVSAYVFPGRDVFVDVELLRISIASLLFDLSVMFPYHLDILLDSRVSNPPLILSVPKVLAFRKITRIPPLLLKRLLEESVPYAELSQNTLIVDPCSSYDPEAYSCNSIIELLCKFLFATGLVEARQVNVGQWRPVKVFFCFLRSAPWLDEELVGGLWWRGDCRWSHIGGIKLRGGKW